MKESTLSVAFTDQLEQWIRAIPPGRVATYGRLAAAAGQARGARQVVRFLHSSAESRQLPWHRIIDRNGYLVLSSGRDLQRALLEAEGVEVGPGDQVDLGRFLWEDLM